MSWCLLWRRRGYPPAHLKGLGRGPERVTDHLFAVKVPQPKKHFSPGQIRIVDPPKMKQGIKARTPLVWVAHAFTL